MTPEEQAVLLAQPSWKDGRGLFDTPYINPFGPGTPARVIRSKDDDDVDPSDFPGMNLPPPSSQSYTVCGTVQSSPPTQDSLLAMVSTTFNGVSGTDFGYGTGRPLQMVASQYFKALFTLSGNAALLPLSTHGASLSVTPPCTFTGAVTSGGASTVNNRTGCFAASSQVGASAGDAGQFTSDACPGLDPTCPPTCTAISATWGGSGTATETVDFSNVTVVESDWASVSPSSTVWVSYAFAALAQWDCTQSGCQDPADPSNPCTNPGGAPCGPIATGSTGSICSNIIGIGDPGSPPSGTTSSQDIVITDGVSFNTTPGTLALFFCDPTTLSGCTPGMTITY